MKSNYIGRVYDSKNYGKFKILNEMHVGIVNNQYLKRRYFKIQFLNTGFVTYVEYEAMRHGAVKDYSVPIVANIGYVGNLCFEDAVSDIYHHDLYVVWNDMINRCYNVSKTSYDKYGGIGVRVDPDWHCFANFYHDAINLPGYHNKLMYPEIYQLDKDYLQLNIPKYNRVYSKDTCIWISCFDNTALMNVDNTTGYYGVRYAHGGYYTIVSSHSYGKFSIPEAAANLYNLIYPQIMKCRPFREILILNKVKYISFNDLNKYAIGNSDYKELVQRLFYFLEVDLNEAETARYLNSFNN